MDSKVCVSLLALLSVALAVAGGMEAGAAGTVSYHSVNDFARRLTAGSPSPTSMLVGVEEHRRILRSISPSSLNPDRPACLKSCPAPGRPYTGRGCTKAYQCAG